MFCFAHLRGTAIAFFRIPNPLRDMRFSGGPLILGQLGAALKFRGALYFRRSEDQQALPVAYLSYGPDEEALRKWAQRWAQERCFVGMARARAISRPPAGKCSNAASSGATKQGSRTS